MINVFYPGSGSDLRPVLDFSRFRRMMADAGAIAIGDADADTDAVSDPGDRADTHAGIPDPEPFTFHYCDPAPEVTAYFEKLTQNLETGLKSTIAEEPILYNYGGDSPDMFLFVNEPEIAYITDKMYRPEDLHVKLYRTVKADQHPEHAAKTSTGWIRKEFRITLPDGEVIYLHFYPMDAMYVYHNILPETMERLDAVLHIKLFAGSKYRDDNPLAPSRFFSEMAGGPLWNGIRMIWTDMPERFIPETFRSTLFYIPGWGRSGSNMSRRGSGQLYLKTPSG